MPLNPSPTMQLLARRRLVDLVKLFTITNRTVDTDPVTLQPATPRLETMTYRGHARVHQEANEWQPGTGRTFGLRELGIWFPDFVDVSVNDVVRLVTVKGDPSLNDVNCTVIEVQRQTSRAVRRCVVRLPSTQ